MDIIKDWVFRCLLALTVMGLACLAGYAALTQSLSNSHTALVALHTTGVDLTTMSVGGLVILGLQTCCSPKRRPAVATSQ